MQGHSKRGQSILSLLFLTVALSGLQACGGGGGTGLDDTQSGVEQYALAISPDGRTVASGGTYVVTTYGGYYADGVSGVTGRVHSGSLRSRHRVPTSSGPLPSRGKCSSRRHARRQSTGQRPGDSNAPPDESNAGEGDLDRKGPRRLGRRAFARLARAQQTTQKQATGGRAARLRPAVFTPIRIPFL